jgi:hypothetical protein
MMPRGPHRHSCLCLVHPVEALVHLLSSAFEEESQ